jgi:peroxiredoxin Q/BCP
MNKLSLFLCLSAIAAHSSTFTLPIPEKGSLTPNIQLTEIAEEFFDISYFKGQKIALIFLPTTARWQTQLHSIKERYNDLKNYGITPVFVSISPRDELLEFVDNNEFPFPIFHADLDAVKAYGANTLLGGVNRYTFLINENGAITQVITKVDKRNHAQQIIDGFASLR